MRLRHIEVFQAIMHCGTVSAAAKRLNVSQPNVTKVLAHAEQQLGFALFARVKGRLQPTEEALALMPEVERVYAQLGRVHSLSQRLAAGYSGHVRLAITPTLGQVLLPRVLPLFYRQSPQVVSDVQTLHGGPMMQQLLAGELDIGLAFSPGETPGIQQQALYQGELQVLLPPQGRSERWPAQLTPEMLGQLPWPLIGLSPRDRLGAQLQTLLAQQAQAPEVLMTVQTYSLAVDLVREGLGFAVVDEFTARAYAASEWVRPLTPAARFSVSVLSAEARPPSRVAQRLLSCFESVLSERSDNCP